MTGRLKAILTAAMLSLMLAWPPQYASCADAGPGIPGAAVPDAAAWSGFHPEDMDDFLPHPADKDKPDKEPTELEKIKKAIKDKGARWKAGETKLSKLSKEERKKRASLSLAPLPRNERSPATLSQSPPSGEQPLEQSITLDWRDNGGNFVTGVRDQLSCGSCWAFGSTAALESAVLLSMNIPGVDLDLSEQVVLSCSGEGSCSGGPLVSDFMVDHGTPLESCYPYTNSNGNCADACPDWQNDAYRATAYTWVVPYGATQDVQTLKDGLNTHGPITIAYAVYNDFYSYTGGIYSYVTGPLTGYHAVLLVGYDDVNSCFIVKNSWGSGWGEAGYFRIAYTEVSNVVDFGYWAVAYDSATPPLSSKVTDPVKGQGINGSSYIVAGTATAGVGRTVTGVEVSTDGGTNWQPAFKSWSSVTVDSIGYVGDFTSIALDSTGSPHISYFDNYNQKLKYARHANGFWNITTINSAGMPSTGSSIAIDAADNAHISYIDYNAELNYATNAGGFWNTTTIGSAVNSTMSSICLDSLGKAHISYCDSFTIKHATNSSGSWAIETVDDTAGIGSSSIAIDSMGKLHISYKDTSLGKYDLKYATNAPGFWTYSTIDVTGDVGAFSSIALDSNGKVHISYYDNTNHDLKYATNETGTWVTSVVDSEGDVGTWTSIEIDSNDKAHISYTDSSPSNLNYASNASGTWMTYLLDTVGYHTSLAIDSSDKVHISYYNSYDSDLRYTTNSTADTWDNWSYAWDITGLPDGPYNLKSRATDDLANVEPLNSGVNVVVDHVEPASAITSPPDGSVLSGTTRAIRGTATDASGSGVQLVEISTDGGNAWSPATDTSVDGSWSSWEYVWTLPADGSYIVNSRATDKSGNEEQQPFTGIALYVDHDYPYTTITYPANGDRVDGITCVVTGTAAEGSGTGITSVEVSLDGGESWQPASGTDTWSYAIPVPNPGGLVSVISRATNNLAQTETPAEGIGFVADNFAAKLWTRAVGGTGYDVAKRVAVDADGNAYAAGYAQGDVDGQTGAGGIDACLVKFGPDGRRHFTRLAGTGADDYAEAVALGPAGEVYVAGHTLGGLHGNTSAGAEDIFLIRYDTGGGRLWTVQAGSAQNDVAYGVCTDAAGDIYVTGFTNGGLGGYSNKGGSDFFIIKYHPDGSEAWTVQAGTPYTEYAYSICAAPGGDAFVAGFTYGDFPGYANAGNTDYFTARYTPAGAEVWTVQSGTTGYEYAKDVDADASGNAYVTGYTSGSLGGYPNAGSYDVFAQKLSPSGGSLWLRQMGTASSDKAFGGCLDGQGGFYMAGYTNGGMQGNTNAGGYDIFAARFDTDGVELGLVQTGSAADDFGEDIQATADGKAYVAALTAGSLDGNPFGGEYDFVAMKLASGFMVAESDTACTASDAVTLQSCAHDTNGVSQMQFSNYSTSGWSAWGSYTTVAPWTLSPGDGPKTVYARYRDGLGNESVVFSDAITLDSLAPVSAITYPAGVELMSGVNHTVAGTADSNGGSAVIMVEVSVDGTNWHEAADTSGSGDWSTWSWLWAAPTDGVYNVRSRAINALGNQEPPGPGVTVTLKKHIVLDREAVNVTYQLGGPAAQTTVDVTSTTGTLAFDASSGAAWLSVSPPGATTPATITISALPDANSPGFITADAYVTSAEAGNSPKVITVNVTVQPFGDPELQHYGWDAFLAADCGVCHDAPGSFVPASGMHDSFSLCISCHNAASVGHDMVYEGGHPVFISATSGGCAMPSYGNVTTAEYNNQPFANLGTGGTVVCATCHNVMQKPEDYGRAWELTTTSDYLTFALEKGGWSGYGYVVPVVYRSTGLISAPAYSRARKAYIVAPDKYTYDEAAGTITFGQAQDPADYVYVTLEYPYLRASTEDDRLCSDCHTQAAHQGVNCSSCHTAHGAANLAFVRDTVRAPDGIESPVVLLGYTGADSFADGDGVYDGVCEVCHTLTDYYRRDGSGLADHSGGFNYDGADCTTCHSHASGFAR